MYSKEISVECSCQYWKRKSHLPLSLLKNLRDRQGEVQAGAGGRRGGQGAEARGGLAHRALRPIHRLCF